MTTRITSSLANSMVSGQALATTLAGATISFYTGPMPASPSLAATGTLLASVDAGAPLAFETATGIVGKSSGQSWKLAVEAAGTIGYMRLARGEYRVDTDDVSMFPVLTLLSDVELVAFSLYIPTED